MASIRRHEPTSKVLLEGPLLKLGQFPRQWTHRYFVLTEHDAPATQQLKLSWFSDNLSRLAGEAAQGCCYLTRASSVAMKGADAMVISDVSNPEKPQKTMYNLKNVATSRVDEWAGVMQEWLASDMMDTISLQPKRQVQQQANGGAAIASGSNAPPSSVPSQPRASSLPSQLHPAAEPLPVFARAVFAHAAADGESEELSFAAGATLRVFEQADSGWWLGCVAGSTQEGWFPSNFVRPLSSRAAVEQPAPAAADVLFHAVATHDYDAAAADGSSGPKELPLRQNDVVAVTATHTNGWWLGTTTGGESGWFPSNYVEIAP
jgi:hypothetical protein